MTINILQMIIIGTMLNCPLKNEYKILIPSGKEKWISSIVYRGPDNKQCAILKDTTKEKESQKSVDMLLKSKRPDGSRRLISSRAMKIIQDGTIYYSFHDIDIT